MLTYPRKGDLMSARRRLVGRLVLSLALATLGLAVACNGSGDDAAEALETRIREGIEAANNGDFDTWYEGSTEAGLRRTFPNNEDFSTEGVREQFAAFSGTHSEIVAIRDIVVDGDRGEATVENAFSFEGSDPDVRIISASRGVYVKEDGEWKFDDYQWVSPRMPEGITKVPVTAREFEYEFDASDFRDGKIAMELENAGEQPHQVDIRRIPEDLDLEGWVDGSEFSLSIVPIGGTPPVDPGTTRTIVFTAPLSTGRYVMACFTADADDPDLSHLDRGMYAEFTVE
jgi:hypothetical protein